jgi:phosphoesterase RecJ-like protein
VEDFSQFKDFFDRYSLFLIIGHTEPDGDCLSSQLVLSSYLERTGKNTILISAGPFTRTEIHDLEPLFHHHVPEEIDRRTTAVCIVDCSTLERIGYLGEEIEGLPIAVIDHHSAGKDFGTLRWIETSAPSVTFMIQKLIHGLGGLLEPEEAQTLLFGLATDTGYFRHLAENSDEVFKAAAELIQYGANPKAAYMKMYGGRSFNSRKLLGRILNRIESDFDGQAIYCFETLEDCELFGKESRDSDGLYQLLQGIAGAEVIVLIREEVPGFCSVGLRSKHFVDVGLLARQFGGGGHARAAGFSRYAERDSILVDIKKALENHFHS